MRNRLPRSSRRSRGRRIRRRIRTIGPRNCRPTRCTMHAADRLLFSSITDTRSDHPMKAIRVHEFGGPEALRFEDVPEPTPKPNDAVVKIDAAGVNFIDIYQRTGIYKLPLPTPLGVDA